MPCSIQEISRIQQKFMSSRYCGKYSGITQIIIHQLMNYSFVNNLFKSSFTKAFNNLKLCIQGVRVKRASIIIVLKYRLGICAASNGAHFELPYL